MIDQVWFGNLNNYGGYSSFLAPGGSKDDCLIRFGLAIETKMAATSSSPAPGEID
jgi:hypothetical protein